MKKTSSKGPFRKLMAPLMLAVFLFAPSFGLALTPHVVPSPLYGIRGGGENAYSGSGGGNSGPVATGISVSCSPSMLTATVGQTVTWISSVTGGSGSYRYTWNGTDGLSGNTSTLAKAYGSTGEKFASLTVTSGGKAITVSCGTVQIGSGFPTQFQPGFGASCYATPERALIGESVTWVSVVSGITASTTYTWDGTDNLTGDRPIVSKIYATNGTKIAFLTVTNGPIRIVAACTNAVTVGPKVVAIQRPAPKPIVIVATTTPAILDVKGLCAPSATKAKTGEEVLWQAAVVGGTGGYSFGWTGDDGLLAEGTTTATRYGTPGIKKATVTITSGGKSATIACTQIEIEKRTNGLFAGGFFSWFDSPLCLILAVILAIMIGLAIARRKRAKEEEEEEKDHVK